jgi:putative ABC transport system ATP-binding protein
MGEVDIDALSDISLEIDRGRFVVIAGPSGAGKTTLLNILGGMDSPDSGRVEVDGEDIAAADGRRLTEYRRSAIGFVFQFYNLVPNLTALENVELATQICDHALDPGAILGRVGLSGRLDNFPAQLSGGEQQRVSIARALSKSPKLLLCDEPTGALDYETGKSVLGLLRETSRAEGMTVLLITHNLAIAPMADMVVRLKNGRVDSVAHNAHPAEAGDISW